jgi:hypothetical protein
MINYAYFTPLNIIIFILMIIALILIFIAIIVNTFYKNKTLKKIFGYLFKDDDLSEK